MEYPFSFQSYQSRSLPFSAQRLVNMYYESGVTGTKTQGILFNRPSKTLFSTLGSSSVRGIETMVNVPFIVVGKEVYTVDSAGVETLAGALPGTDRVSMSNNGTQVAIVTGTDGYIATASTVTQITDVNFPAVSSVTYQDGYFIWTIADTDQIQLSPLNDGTGPYDPLDIATAEVAPDNLVAVFADHDDLFLMGEDTIEPWYNSGDVDTPFVPRGGTVMEVGLAARDSVVKLDNSIFWLGNAGERGGLTVWRAAGYTPTRVSTHAWEKKWEEAGDVSSANGFSFRLEGHDFYALTVPGAGTAVYDASTGFWCEWQAGERDDFEVVGFTDSFNKKIVGSSTEGKLYSLSVDVYTDDGATVYRNAVSPPLATPNNNRARHNFVRIDIETGVGLTTGQGSDPIMDIRWSNEDGVKFGNWHQMSMGKIGETKRRAYIRRLGIARSRIYEIRTSDPVKTAILGAYVDMTEGTS